jgi:ferritin-like metal-binding protein YciE
MRTVNIPDDGTHWKKQKREIVLKTFKLYSMPNNDLTITTLHQLLVFDVGRFVSAEVQLQKKLPEWTDTASSPKLKASLHKCLEFVTEHLQKLDNFIEAEKIDQLPLFSRIMQAFILETEEKLSHCSDHEVRDACLLACIQEINHFKISAYGTAAAFAKALGFEEQAGVFHEAEVNEKQIDDRLSQLAEHEINLKARAPIILPL